MYKRLFFLMVVVSVEAQAETEKSQQVVVHGGKSDIEASRDVIAGKIIVGKQRIAESGLQNIGELLRREPAISVGKDGRIGLLGLPGYTQILVDGAPYSGDPFSLDLVHIDRIEIVKSSTASSGPFGIAGTINIVRKRAEHRAYRTLRAGGSTTSGRMGADMAWSSNQVAQDGPFSYQLSLSANRKPTRGDSRYAETRQAVDTPDQPLHEPAYLPTYSGERSTRGAVETLTVGTELTWGLAADHKLSLSPDAARIRIVSAGTEQRHWADSRWFAGTTRNDETMTGYSLPLRWNWRVDADSSLIVKLSRNRSRLDVDAFRTDSWSAGGPFLRQASQRRRMTDSFLDLEYFKEFDTGHELTLGARLLRNEEDIGWTDTLNGRPDTSLAVLGNASASRTDGRRLFVQDEWRIDRTFALNLGTSVEQRRYALDEGAASSRTRFTMWSPSAHLSKKIAGNSKRQIRLSVARSFQPPSLVQLQLHPILNPFAPCAPGMPCDANTIDTADGSGSPDLQPERALGLNLSYTRGVGKDSELVLELYKREIENKIGSEFGLETVPWASAPRYVYRPANLGQARVRGLNIEGRIAGKDLWKSAPDWEVHGSLGWTRSRLDDVPGPDNRLAGQSPFRAKLGASLAMRSLPVKLGVEASYLPGDWLRSNLSERVYQSSKTTLGASAAWTLGRQARLSIHADDLVQRSSRGIHEYLGSAEILRRDSSSPNHARWTIRFETKL